MVAFSDGGCRQGDCSASAWAVAIGVSTGDSWSYSLARVGGKFFLDPVNSFLAETVALEEATIAAYELCAMW